MNTGTGLGVSGEERTSRCRFAGAVAALRARGPGVLGTAVLSAVVSAAVTAGGLCFYDQRYAQKVVVFDLPGYVDAVQRELGQGRMTEEQMAGSLTRVEQLLSTVSANHVVLSREVVLKNARELPLPVIGLEVNRPSDRPQPPARTASPSGWPVPEAAKNGQSLR